VDFKNPVVVCVCDGLCDIATRFLGIVFRCLSTTTFAEMADGISDITGRWQQCIRHALLLHLTSESVKGAALALECVYNVHGGYGLATSVLGVRDRVTDDILKEHLQHTAGFFIDESRNALDTTTASEAADSRLGDALDVVAQHLAVALGATFAESLSSFSTSRHCCELRLK
jgi:hypothetical protein